MRPGFVLEFPLEYDSADIVPETFVPKTSFIQITTYSPMAKFALELPAIQNWSCHNCGGCCKKHAINITQEEHQRIENQKWGKSDELPQHTKLFVRTNAWGKYQYRLNHQPDGSCIFLDPQGLCRIHAKFGEQAKPLACRIYPFAFHPKGKKVVVSLRYSCPSVVANKGAKLNQQLPELETIAEQIVPENYQQISPSLVHSSEKLDWSDFLKLVQQLEHFLRSPNVPLEVRLLRAIEFVHMLSQASLGKIQGSRMRELCELLAMDIEARLIHGPEESGDISKLGMTHFRLLVGQYAREDTFSIMKSGWSYRWKMLQSNLAMASGKGHLIGLSDDYPSLPFTALEQPLGGLPRESIEVLSRYFLVKLQGMHFCGPAFYNMNLVDGFASLAAVFPVICYLARWRAVGQGRDKIVPEDVELALARVDHHHGYSPALSGYASRNRIRFLLHQGDLSRLIDHYAK